MKPDLSPPQAKFANEVAKHGNLSKAYRAAYPASRKWLEKSVNEKASHLMARGKIGARVAELRAASEKKLGKSREDWLNELAHLAWNRRNCEQLAALVQYGKALGYFAPEKVEHKVEGSVEQTIRVVGIEARIAAVLAMSEKQGVVLPPVERLAIGAGKGVAT